jgi:hypothetical protein
VNEEEVLGVLGHGHGPQLEGMSVHIFMRVLQQSANKGLNSD